MIEGEPAKIESAKAAIESLLKIQLKVSDLSSLFSKVNVTPIVTSGTVVTQTVYLPTKVHGLIVGPKGETINHLQQEYHAKIRVPTAMLASEVITLQTYEANMASLITAIESVARTKVSLAPSSGAASSSSSSSAPPAFTKLDLSSTEINDVLFFPDTTGSSDFDRFIRYLASARSTLEISIYTLTDDRISRVLEDLHSSGVKIRILSEGSTMDESGSDIASLAKFGLDVKVDESEFLMHHKFVVIDSVFLLNGSFNWTRSASSGNQENVMCTNNKYFVKQYQQQFEKIFSKGRKVQ